MLNPKPEMSGLRSVLRGPLGRINLGATDFTIGRASDNRLVLDDLQVSSYHAKIYLEEERYYIVDLDSLNGTFVNEHRLDPKVQRSLHPNEQIRFGQNTSNPGTTFIYEIVGVEPVVPTRVAPPLSHISADLQGSEPAAPSAKPPARSRPTIRNILAGQTDYKPSSGMSAKEYAELLAPLIALSGSSLFIYIKAAEFLAKALGGKATDRLRKVFPGPYEYTAIVLSFALAFRKTELEIVSIYDTASGSVIEGKLSKRFISSGEGTIAFEFIDESPVRIIVDATTEIKGWGKSKKAFEELFECGEQYVRRITGVGHKN